jgi:hypothetical protein
MGEGTTTKPIPTLTLPLKGREAGAPIIAHDLAFGSVVVISAQAGIQKCLSALGSRLRVNDMHDETLLK